MKDITNSHKSFPKEKENINVANFANMSSIKSVLDNYFEHAPENIVETNVKQAPSQKINLDNKVKKTETEQSQVRGATKPVEQTKTKYENKTPVVLDSTNPEVLYNSLINIINSIKNKIQNNEKFEVTSFLPLLPKLVKFVNEDNKLLTMALNPGRTTEWFASHSLNTTIIAIKISAGLNYNNKQMYALALSTLLHDIGMLKIDPDILANPGQLSAIQRKKLKKHPNLGVNLVGHLRQKYPFIERTIYQEHEKWDGSGYPNHIKGEAITPFARIIALADKFESLVHERSYRNAFKPLLAIQKIMNEGNEAFDPKVLKAFINEISMYPVGSYVMLNTGQIAQVMSVNKNRPVRPLVKILTTNDGRKKDVPEDLNLEKEPLTYITKAVSYLD
jgi:HD-GYP domain-containing protein (c-di-GMP phosphodiesterase class II)